MKDDDHSRKFWFVRLENETDDTIVVDGSMKHLHDKKYDSILTYNGSQFSRRNSVMKNIANSI